MLITCLGLSGSGKTVFFASLVDSLFSYANEIDGFHLLDLQDDASGSSVFGDSLNTKEISIRGNLERLDYDSEFSGFPENTSATTFREFSLMRDEDRLVNVQWVDYKGGLISENTGSDAQKEEIYGFLRNSSAIVVFLDASRLAAAKSTKQAGVFVGADKIAQILTHLASEKSKESVNVLIVLTQVDAVECETHNWFGEDDDLMPLKLRALEVLGGLRKIIEARPNWRGGIVGTSAVGIGNSKRTFTKEMSVASPAESTDQLIGFPEPVNVVESFFWLMSCELEAAKKNFEKKTANKNRQKKTMSSLETKRKLTAEAIKNAHRKERERLKKLEFLPMLWNHTLGKKGANQRLGENIQNETDRLSVKQLEKISKIETEMKNVREDILKHKKSLMPLIKSSREVVFEI